LGKREKVRRGVGGLDLQGMNALEEGLEEGLESVHLGDLDVTDCGVKEPNS
jgi:hypothetical protein